MSEQQSQILEIERAQIVPKPNAAQKNNIPESAMIFAAGLGMRMRPLTETTPKPLIKVLGKPLIDYKIDKLVEAGVKKLVVNTHHLADQIGEHLKQRSDIEISISYEETRLETGGGVLKALPTLGFEPFLTINSDIIWIDNDNEEPLLQRIADFWDSREMDLLLALHPVKTAIGYSGKGDFNLDDNGNLLRITDSAHDYVYSGIMMINPKILHEIRNETNEEFFSLSELFRKYHNDNALSKRIFGIVNDGKWLHIDSVETLKEAEDFLSK